MTATPSVMLSSRRRTDTAREKHSSILGEDTQSLGVRGGRCGGSRLSSLAMAPVRQLLVLLEI